MAGCILPARSRVKIRAQAEHDSGVRLTRFGFITESMFTFIPEPSEPSPRDSVWNFSGITFTIPHHLRANFIALRRNLMPPGVDEE